MLELKPTRQPTKIEIIRQLLDEIELMLEAGVTYGDIARFLKERSVDVTEASLKSTLSKVRKEKKTENLGGNDSTGEDATAALDGEGSDASNSETKANK
ncbi:hypothetical protein SZ28_20125 [Burkholderia pseudomallei]|nr:hypothetical protein SZ28_20125 [Burkholderia pseudomallei]